MPELPPHLEDGVLLLVLGAVPGRVLPGDLEALGLAVQPDQPGVHPAVHLGHQPRLQPHPARVQGHALQGGQQSRCWRLLEPHWLQRNGIHVMRKGPVLCDCCCFDGTAP